MCYKKQCTQKYLRHSGWEQAIDSFNKLAKFWAFLPSFWFLELNFVLIIFGCR